MGGNIGRPLIEYVDGAWDWGVVEVSSFQLEWVRDFRPRVALFLNLSEDHLDRYDSLSSYGAAKARIFAAQRPDDVAVLNRDDPHVWELRGGLAARVVSFGWSEVEEGAFATADAIVWRGGGMEERFALRDVRLRGVHNVENVMAALCAARAVGVESAQVRAAAKRFPGESSTGWSSCVSSTARATSTTPRAPTSARWRSRWPASTIPSCLIAGGVHKGGSYRGLEPLVRKRVRKLILLGEAAGVMREALGSVDRHGGGEGFPARRSSRPGPRPAPATWCCCRRRARVSTCSRTTLSGDACSGSWSRPYERECAAWIRWMLMSLVVLLGIGITMVLNTSYLFSQERFGDGTYLFRRQLAAAGVGLVGLAVALLLPPSFNRRLAGPLLRRGPHGAGAGVDSRASAWSAAAPTAGWACPRFVFQPSEVAKVSFVLYLAYTLSRRAERLDRFVDGGCCRRCWSPGLFVALLLAEPDFGSAFILALIALAMLFVAGSKVGHLACVALAALPMAGLLIMSADYRVKRLLAFMDPWSDSADSGFPGSSSRTSRFGSGQLWGRGLGQSRQKLLYLPEAHTDFIYSVIGEELGLWGALLVVVLFGVLLFRGMRLALESEDSFVRLMVFRPHHAAGASGARPHERGHGTGAHQGPGAAVRQLRRLGAGGALDGRGDAPGRFPAGDAAMRLIVAGGGTGGHLFPGLAVAREFRRRNEDARILFVGSRWGIESRVIPETEFPLELLPVRGLKGRGLKGLLEGLYGIPLSLLRSLAIIRRFRPAVHHRPWRLRLGTAAAGGRVAAHPLRDHGAEPAPRAHQPRPGKAGGPGLHELPRKRRVFPRAPRSSSPAPRCAGGSSPRSAPETGSICSSSAAARARTASTRRCSTPWPSWAMRRRGSG